MRRSRADNEAAPTLPGMPEPEAQPETPNAGHLVAAYCIGYAETHDGSQPHPSVVRRVAGICRNIAKDCDTREDWVAAWWAAKSTGIDGRYDIVGRLAEPAAPTVRGNNYLALVRGASTPSTGTAAALSQTLALGQ